MKAVDVIENEREPDKHKYEGNGGSHTSEKSAVRSQKSEIRDQTSVVIRPVSDR
jgi:hypothetical protein